MKKTPYATYILLAANLIVFFASELLGGSEDYATMLRLGAFPDVVQAVECGMTGPWGEMHSTNYREPHHIRAIVNPCFGGGTSVMPQ